MDGKLDARDPAVVADRVTAAIDALLTVTAGREQSTRKRP
jgi:hypothetical protein